MLTLSPLADDDGNLLTPSHSQPDLAERDPNLAERDPSEAGGAAGPAGAAGAAGAAGVDARAEGAAEGAAGAAEGAAALSAQCGAGASHRWLSKLGREALAGGGSGAAAGGGSGGGVALVGDAAGVLHLFHLPPRASAGRAAGPMHAEGRCSLASAAA